MRMYISGLCRMVWKEIRTYEADASRLYNYTVYTTTVNLYDLYIGLQVFISIYLSWWVKFSLFCSLFSDYFELHSSSNDFSDAFDVIIKIYQASHITTRVVNVNRRTPMIIYIRIYLPVRIFTDIFSVQSLISRDSFK